MSRFEIVEYDSPFEPANGLQATYVEAGHMLGSASIVLEAEGRRLLFSGDLGPPDLPFLRDPEPPPGPFNVIVCESTYGDRDHRALDETVAEFGNIIEEAVRAKGKVLIPSFAIGRAQNMLFHIAELVRERRIPRIPVYLDSPMAISATHIYTDHEDLFDEESTELVEHGTLERDLRTVRFTVTAEESRAINGKPGPFIVIAGAGMCNAGRILHHLRNNLDDPDTHVVITGYQARGSLGRKLVDGAQHVSIMGEYKEVRATIHTLGGFSAHAGQTHLLAWLGSVTKARGEHDPHILLTHGEDTARQALAERVAGMLGTEPVLPSYGISLELPT
jgi:metallo-beta-lactamase family protein